MVNNIFCKLNFFITVILLVFSLQSPAQVVDTIKCQKNYGVGFFPSKKSKIIYGLAAGPFTIANQHHVYNGFTVELLGTGLIAAMAGGFDSSFYEFIRNKSNGLALSLMGSQINSNGIYISGFGLASKKVNGLSVNLGYSMIKEGNGIIVSGFNFCETINGIQIGAFTNSESLKGVQIGFLTNKVTNLKGIQIGLWNVNKKRKLPLVNWCFKS